MRIPHNKTDPIVEKEIIGFYQKGTSSTQISKLYDVDCGTVLNILRRYNIPVRSMRAALRKYSYNESFFENIDTEEKAYWLGFILTDGCVSIRNEWKKDLIVTIKDIGHLEKFISAIEGNNQLQTIRRKNKIYETLSIRCQKMVNDLVNLGITPRKSMTVRIPILPDELQCHFWRGVIDGDGTMGFYVNKKRYNHKSFNIGLVGNEFVIQSFVKYIKDKLGVCLNYHPNKSIFRVATTNSRAVKISKLLYQNASIFLDRKMKLAVRSFVGCEA